MTELNRYDLQMALRRMPRELIQLMKTADYAGRVYVGGGFLRAIVSGEEVNDIDIFVDKAEEAVVLAKALIRLRNPELNGAESDDKVAKKMHRTANAITIFGFKPTLQIIHRWLFSSGIDVCGAFDFTCCCAAFWYNGKTWVSYVDPSFYQDVAAKRLVYRSPDRNEDAGGSLLRVLKYYQKGYRMPLESLGAVIARLMTGVQFDGHVFEGQRVNEAWMARVISSLLREVDPLVDPEHVAHEHALPEEIESKTAL